MKRYLRHILILLAAIMILVPSCKREAPRMIPRSKLAKIYAEMFVMDQWIQLKPGLRTIADTSLVYEPILEKYGYDSEDYQYSVDRYMDDPERFSRILRTTAEILDKEIRSLQKQQAELKLHEEKKKAVARYEITMFQFYDELISEDGLIDWSDSLDVAWDTVYNAYRFRRIHRTDTIYEGPRMIVSDTLSVSDTLAADSLAVSDSLKVTDSLKLADSLKALPKLKVTSPRAMETAEGLARMRVDTTKKRTNPRSSGRPPLLPPRKKTVN